LTPAPRILVVNGHSNAGKSFFCSWLVSAHGCTVVDCDKGGIDAAGLRVPWDAVAAGDASPLRAELASHRRATVIDWPYNPPSGFTYVEALQAAGIPAWWLDADPAAAEASFIGRGQGDIEDFYRHARAVDLHRERIRALYCRRYMVTLHSDGRRERVEDIWGAVCAVEGWYGRWSRDREPPLIYSPAPCVLGPLP
jgi:hypothetical protein